MSTNENRISPDDPRLTAFALGELEGVELAQMEAELRADPAAQAIVAQIRVAADQFQAALADETLEAAAGVEGRVQPSGLESRYILRRFLLWGIPLAACLAVLLVHGNLRRRAHEPEIGEKAADQSRVESLAVHAQSEAVALSPFEVNAGRAQGYITPYTTTGTRLASNIGDIPSSVTVIDKQQLENTNAQNAPPMPAAARPAAPPPVHRFIQVQSLFAGASLGGMPGDRGSVTTVMRKDSAADKDFVILAAPVPNLGEAPPPNSLMFGSAGSANTSVQLSADSGVSGNSAALQVSDNSAWIQNQIERGVSFDQLTTAPNPFPADLTAP